MASTLILSLTSVLQKLKISQLLESKLRLQFLLKLHQLLHRHQRASMTLSHRSLSLLVNRTLVSQSSWKERNNETTSYRRNHLDLLNLLSGSNHCWDWIRSKDRHKLSDGR